jgi:hypothetical protein
MSDMMGEVRETWDFWSGRPSLRNHCFVNPVLYTEAFIRSYVTGGDSRLQEFMLL